MEKPTTDRQLPRTVIEAKLEGWQGPLPHPDILARFEEVIPGGAERIVHMAEVEQQHRLAQESKNLEATIASTRRGQYLGATIALFAIVGAVLNTYFHGHWSVSVALVGVPVASIVNALARK